MKTYRESPSENGNSEQLLSAISRLITNGHGITSTRKGTNNVPLTISIQGDYVGPEECPNTGTIEVTQEFIDNLALITGNASLRLIFVIKPFKATVQIDRKFTEKGIEYSTSIVISTPQIEVGKTISVVRFCQTEQEKRSLLSNPPQLDNVATGVEVDTNRTATRDPITTIIHQIETEKPIDTRPPTQPIQKKEEQDTDEYLFNNLSPTEQDIVATIDSIADSASTIKPFPLQGIKTSYIIKKPQNTKSVKEWQTNLDQSVKTNQMPRFIMSRNIMSFLVSPETAYLIMRCLGETRTDILQMKNTKIDMGMGFSSQDQGFIIMIQYI